MTTTKETDLLRTKVCELPINKESRILLLDILRYKPDAIKDINFIYREVAKDARSYTLTLSEKSFGEVDITIASPLGIDIVKIITSLSVLELRGRFRHQSASNDYDLHIETKVCALV